MINQLEVTVANGKYTVIQDERGRLSALRYGEPWRDCCGDGLIYALASELQDYRDTSGLLKELITAARAMLAAVTEKSVGLHVIAHYIPHQTCTLRQALINITNNPQQKEDNKQ